MAKNNKHSSGLVAGVGMAAMAAAAAGAYYFYHSEKGIKQRKQLKSWMVKAKGDMLEKVEKMKSVSKDAYHKAAKEVMDKYKRVKNIDPKELAALGLELKAQWDKIAKHLSAPAPKKRKAKGRKK